MPDSNHSANGGVNNGYKPEPVAIIAAGNAIDIALQKSLQRVGFRVQLLRPEQLDELNPRALVINASACRSVRSMDAALDVCRSLAQRPCRGLLHLSSYRVFPGAARKRYDEDDEPAPATEGGHRWLECEQALADVENLSLLRLGWLVDRNRNALLARVLRGLLEHKPLELDDSSRGCPVTVADLVRVVTAMVQQLGSGAPMRGIYHYGAADSCTALEFGREVAERVQSLYGDDYPAELHALQGEEADASVILSCTRLRDVFGIQQRSWRQGLTRQVELWLERLEKSAE